MAHKHNEEPYEVGYCRPPVSTRFQPGQSGNRRGRAKGKRNLATDLREALAQEVTVTEGGKTRKMSKGQLMLVRTLNEAVKGDIRAFGSLIKVIIQLGMLEPERIAPRPDLNPEDAAILEHFLRSQKQS